MTQKLHQNRDLEELQHKLEEANLPDAAREVGFLQHFMGMGTIVGNPYGADVMVGEQVVKLDIVERDTQTEVDEKVATFAEEIRQLLSTLCVAEETEGSRVEITHTEGDPHIVTFENASQVVDVEVYVLDDAYLSRLKEALASLLKANPHIALSDLEAHTAAFQKLIDEKYVQLAQSGRPHEGFAPRYLGLALVNGIRVVVAWYGREYELHLPQIETRVDPEVYDQNIKICASADVAESVFEYAKTVAAMPGATAYDVYKKVDDYIDNRRFSTPTPKPIAPPPPAPVVRSSNTNLEETISGIKIQLSSSGSTYYLSFPDAQLFAKLSNRMQVGDGRIALRGDPHIWFVEAKRLAAQGVEAHEIFFQISQRVR